MKTVKTIDELKEYKEKLAKLTEEEKEQRDLYLKKLTDGTLQGPPTGYSSIDKQWLKYYEDDKLNQNIESNSIYEYRKNKNKGFEKNISLNYMGLKITNRKFDYKIEETAKALKKIGIKKGDIISLCSVCTPETGYLLYAANKLGAIVDLFDPRTSKIGIEKYFESSKSKYFFVLDNFLGDMYDKSKNTSVEKIIHISPYDSFPKIVKILISLRKKTQDEIEEETKINKIISTLEDNSSNILSWNKFILNVSQEKEVKTEKSTKDDVAAIVHTGGTTGLPKGVKLTNGNFIAQYLNYSSLDFDLKANDKYLDVLVPWVAYGLVFSFFVTSCLNLEHILIPSFIPENMPELILKYKPNQILGIPRYYESLINNPKMEGKDLSFLKCMGSGGDHISPDLEEKLNIFLKEHNSESKFVKGYGMTELSSSVCTCLKNINEIGSVGVPLVNNIIAIFDPDTMIEKKYNELGEICIKSPTMMKSYDDVTKNDSIMKKHNDGTIWIHSGDIGYMTSNGCLFVVDRIKRMVIRQGFKVYPSEIEKVITSHPAIDFCTVVGIPNKNDVHTPKAYMVLNSEYIGHEEQVINEIKQMLKENLPDYEIPYDDDYEFRKSIPHTSLGKVDFQALIDENKSRIK